MFELEKTDAVKKLIAVTKSDSGISGPQLAMAHMELGKLMGLQMTEFNPEDTTVVAMLRGGIFFAEGIYFSMGCKFQTYDPKHEVFVRPKTKNVILDITKSGLTDETVKEQIKKIFWSKETQFIDEIVIVNGESIVGVYKRKKGADTSPHLQ